LRQNKRAAPVATDTETHTHCATTQPSSRQQSFFLEGRHALDAMWQAMKAPAGRQAVPSAVAPATVSGWLCRKSEAPGCAASLPHPRSNTNNTRAGHPT
jgi:hypothetical protein